MVPLHSTPPCLGHKALLSPSKPLLTQTCWDLYKQPCEVGSRCGPAIRVHLAREAPSRCKQSQGFLCASIYKVASVLSHLTMLACRNVGYLSANPFVLLPYLLVVCTYVYNVGALMTLMRRIGRGVSCTRIASKPHRDTTVDDINPALPIIRNIQQIPKSRVIKAMPDVYHQPLVQLFRALI